MKDSGGEARRARSSSSTRTANSPSAPISGPTGALQKYEAYVLRGGQAELAREPPGRRLPRLQGRLRVRPIRRAGQVHGIRFLRRAEGLYHLRIRRPRGQHDRDLLRMTRGVSPHEAPFRHRHPDDLRRGRRLRRRDHGGLPDALPAGRGPAPEIRGRPQPGRAQRQDHRAHPAQALAGRFSSRRNPIPRPEDQELYGRTVRILAQALGDYKYADAAPFLWDAAQPVPDPLARAEAIMALGKMRALDYVERIALMLRDLNLQPTADRDAGEKLAYAAIVALDKFKDLERLLARLLRGRRLVLAASPPAGGAGPARHRRRSDRPHQGDHRSRDRPTASCAPSRPRPLPRRRTRARSRRRSSPSISAIRRCPATRTRPSSSPTSASSRSAC